MDAIKNLKPYDSIVFVTHEVCNSDEWSAIWAKLSTRKYLNIVCMSKDITQPNGKIPQNIEAIETINNKSQLAPGYHSIIGQTDGPIMQYMLKKGFKVNMIERDGSEYLHVPSKNAFQDLTII